MPGQSLLVARCRQIEKAIDDAHPRRRPRLLRELLRMLVLREQPTLLRRLAAPLRTIEKQLAPRIGLLACAVYMLCRYRRNRMTVNRAARLVEIPEADLAYVESLAKRTGTHLLELGLQADENVRAEVDGYFEELVVSLDQRAVEDLLLAAVETYAVPPGSRGRYTEAYGLCFGTRKDLRHDLRPQFERIVNVTRIATQMRAETTASQFRPNRDSERVHRQVAEQFFRHLELLGDYHTHPWKDIHALRAARGWRYSPADQARIRDWAYEARAEGPRPRFSLILAVARQNGSSNRNAVRLAPNRVQMGVGDLCLVAAAYRIRRNGYYDSKVRLHVPQLAST